MIYYSTYFWTRPPSPCFDQRESHHKSRVSLIYSEATPRTMALSTFPYSPTKRTLCPSVSNNALFMAEARSFNPSRRIRTGHQSPSHSFYSPALSPSSQNTRHFRHQQQLSKAGLLKPTHPVDTQPLPTRKLACIIPFGASKKMSGIANTGVGQQPSFNTGAQMSLNSSVTSNTSPSTQSFSQSPTPPQTPVLSGMVKTSPVPSLSLDQATTSSPNNSLVTASPYTLNETTSFAPGTAFWQPSTTPTAAAAASSTNPPACHVASNAPSSIRPMTALCPASNIITASPYAQNEGVTFTSGTSFWTSNANTSASATTQSSPPAKTSMINSSPYSQNEGVTFPLGTQMWQSKQ
jgi:hypothetical protein